MGIEGPDKINNIPNEKETINKKQITDRLSPQEKSNFNDSFNAEKEQIHLLTQSKLGVLKDDTIANYLLKNHQFDLNQYDNITKKRFLDEIKNIFDEFKNFDTSMVQSLKDIREDMSLGMESGKSLEYYRNMILNNKIEKRITLLKESYKTINGERVSVGGTQYNKQDYTSFVGGIDELDNATGLKLSQKIELENYQYNFKESFSKEVKRNLDKSSPNYSMVVADLNRLPQVVGEKGFENLKEVVLKNGQTINLEELYSKYNQLYKDFKAKNKVFEFGNKQLQFATNGFGFSEEKYGLGYDELEETYEDKLDDIENMGMSDLVIMARVLFGIIPVAGDIVGGMDDLKQANAGINFDGSLQGIPENMLSYLSGALGITVVGGKLGNVIKGAKLTKVINKLSKVIDRLEKIQGIEKLSSNKAFMIMLENIGKIIPKASELADKLKNLDKEKDLGKNLDEIGKNNIINTLEQRQEKSFKRTGISPDELINRAKKWEIDNNSRFSDANTFLLENNLPILDSKQFQEVMNVHNNISKGLWQNDASDLRKMNQNLKGVGLNKDQIRILIENGVLGKIMDRKSIIKNILENGDLNEKIIFLKTSSIDDISFLLNEGIDIGDDFSIKFTNTLSKIFKIYDDNITNISSVYNEIQKIVAQAEGISTQERLILNGIVDKMSIMGNITSYKNKFRNLSNFSEVKQIIKDLPESVNSREVLDLFEESIEKVQNSIDQKELISAINFFSTRFPELNTQTVMLSIKYLEPSLWKECRVFLEGNLKFSVKGTEFKSILSLILEKNPEKYSEIMKESKPGGLYMLAGMKEQNNSIKVLNSKEFKNNFEIGLSWEEAGKLLQKNPDDITRKEISLLNDTYRLNVLLGEQKDVKYFSASEIISLVGKENIDRFFALSLPNLKEIAKNNEILQQQLDLLNNRYNRQ